jgi:putative DNA primase/helicase
MLRGARLVTAQETEEGRGWAESRIKQLTGGDPITARFMRQDFFTFDPNFKLAIAGNHKPSLKGVDEALRARIHLVPFTVTIPPHERDPDLPEKIRAEGPAILRWMIEGCLAWQERGLDPPEAVRTATEDYMAQEDVLGQWIAERCVEDHKARTSSSELYAHWCGWADRAGELPGTQKAFSSALQARGFVKVKTRRGVVFNGIAPRIELRQEVE